MKMHGTDVNNCFWDDVFMCIWLGELWLHLQYLYSSFAASVCLLPSHFCVCVCVIECKHWKRKEPVNYCIYVQCYCHPTLYFGCNRKYYFVFLFCSFRFNASEIVIDYTRDTGNKWLTGRRRLKVVELFTN